MNTIFHITGGLGKHVLSTAVINSYKDQNPDRNIIVCSAYPSVFDNNPNIDESLQLGQTQYFYKNYIKGKDAEIFAQEPYRQTSHVFKQKHLIDTWCDMIGITHSRGPSLHCNFREKETTKKYLASFSDKPILIFQPFGGNNTTLPYCWARDIHPEIAQNIINMLKDKYNIIHICNPYHVQLGNCIRIEDRLSITALATMLEVADRRILIDSSLQHIAHVIGKKSTVLWNVTDVELFGYSTHFNIPPKLTYTDGYRGSYLFNYEISGLPHECPYMDYNDIFDTSFIYNFIENNF